MTTPSGDPAGDDEAVLRRAQECLLRKRAQIEKQSPPDGRGREHIAGLAQKAVDGRDLGPTVARPDHAELLAEQALARRQAFDDRCVAILKMIPSKFQDAQFGIDLSRRVRKRPEAIAEAQAAVGSPMVLLVGPAGAGKTTLASAIVHELSIRALARDRAAVRAVWNAVWTPALWLARARREHKLGDGEAPEVLGALNASTLVIDDLGLEPEDRDGALTEILYDRHARGAHTIVTTGLRYQQIVHRYGDGIARRLTEKPSVFIRCAP